MNLFRSVGLAVALMTFSASAFAQTAPAGWTVAKTQAQWVATSPDQGRGLTVKLIYTTVQAPSSNLDLWFPEAHQRAARAYGEIVNIGKTDSMGVDAESHLIASTISVKPPAGGRTSVLAYAYDTAAGRQLVLIILPATLSRKNPAYRAAFAAMEDFWNARKVYTPAP